ncbi:hypothetical protein WJT74_11990 [Sphingomicrobium sp. XHP0239]|uniref:hypothetical protein n=1 Tax=Sphingomicrobium maritimum TaxID=3133972 RepID=UPI0031CC60E3
MFDLPPGLVPTQEQVIERSLHDCGLDPRGYTVKYQDYLQGIEVVIAPSAGATSDNFACIKDATGYELVTFEDSEMYSAYLEFTSESARPEMLVHYESKLRDAGLWEGFPERTSFGTLEEYAAALEEHSGLEAGSALRVSGTFIMFDPPDAILDFNDYVERYSDLMTVVAYATTKERIRFGL